jgi:hypothetical protein
MTRGNGYSPPSECAALSGSKGNVPPERQSWVNAFDPMVARPSQCRQLKSIYRHRADQSKGLAETKDGNPEGMKN